MNLRRRSHSIVPLAALIVLAACASSAPRAPAASLPAEALTNEHTIRLRCEDPDGVIAGRALCVLKDLPHGAVVQP